MGPESVGAHPGPVSYRKGGSLAVTDANLVLGRLLPEYFPKIFGPNEDEALDYDGAFRLGGGRGWKGYGGNQGRGCEMGGVWG